MSITLIVGRKGSGKTTLLLNKLTEWRKMNPKTPVILISPTATYQDLYKKNQNLFDFYYSHVDDDVIKEIKKEKDQVWKEKPLVLVFDDIGASPYIKTINKPNKLDKMIINARHYNVHMIWLLQKIKQASTILRDNTDVLYAFRTFGEGESRILQNDFLYHIPKELLPDVTKYCWNDPYSYLKLVREGNQFKVYKNDDEQLKIDSKPKKMKEAENEKDFDL